MTNLIVESLEPSRKGKATKSACSRSLGRVSSTRSYYDTACCSWLTFVHLFFADAGWFFSAAMWRPDNPPQRLLHGDHVPSRCCALWPRKWDSNPERGDGSDTGPAEKWGSWSGVRCHLWPGHVAVFFQPGWHGSSPPSSGPADVFRWVYRGTFLGVKRVWVLIHITWWVFNPSSTPEL